MSMGTGGFSAQTGLVSVSEFGEYDGPKRRMEPCALTSRDWDEDRILPQALQGSISTIPGETTHLAQHSLDPNAEALALLMLV